MNPTENPVIGTLPTVAAANIARGLFVKVNGAICGAGEMGVGICHEDVDTGDPVPYVYGGIGLVLSGAAITAGVELVSDAAGKAIAATALSANTPDGGVAVTAASADPAMVIAGSALPQKILGVALTAATDANQWVAIKL